MKKCILLSLVTLLVVGAFAGYSKAGFEPSPFKDSVDAISLNVNVLGKQIEERLSIPLDDQMPGEVAKGVVKIHDYAGSIVMLNGFLKDIAEEFIFCPGCDVMGIEPSPFKVLRARAKITSHFAISASARLYPIPHSQKLDIACYACDFAQSDRPNPNQIRAPIL
jgi:hypothetical protein